MACAAPGSTRSVAVYLLALGAALLFGLGSVVQQRVAFEAPPGKSLRPSLLLWLVRQPLWLAGVGTAVVGNVLSGTALGLGSVALVQPLLVSRLLFALPVSAAWMRQRLRGRDWLGALATAGGLGLFIAIGHPHQPDTTSPGLRSWLIALGAIAVLVALLVLGSRKLSAVRRAPMLGAGAGILFGLQAGLTHTAVRHFIDSGVLALLTSWSTYAVAAAAVLGTLLNQSAFEMAPLTASYPTLAAVEPLAGIGLGIGLLGGNLAAGPLPLTGEALGLAVMTGGIYLLATSPLVTGQASSIRRREEEEEAYRIEDRLQQELSRLSRMLEEGPRRELPEGAGARGKAARELDRVDDLLRRLDELDRDLQEQHATHQPDSTPQTGPLAEHQRKVEAWAEQIDARRRELREWAGRLHEVAQAGGGGTPPR